MTARTPKKAKTNKIIGDNILMNFPIKNPTFLLPKKEFQLEKWSCIACDQHTSDQSYWQKLSEFVGYNKSTLNLIFPEVYLHSKPESEILDKIQGYTKEYINAKMFNSFNGMVKIERKVSNGKTRHGVLIAIDLEDYSFEKGLEPQIRASEGTVLERIPPRVRVREKTGLEMSHVMLLYDDPSYIVNDAVSKAKTTPLYNFNLNMNGGNISGELIKDSTSIMSAFSQLQAASVARYGKPFLFAVGDGNHSLAAAKAVYEKAKQKGEGEKCRYALCEAVNIYDEALEFEPIYRLVFCKNSTNFLEKLNKKFPTDPIEAVRHVDSFIEKNKLEADYIHGEDNLLKLASEHNAAAVKLKAIEKAGFFPYIAKNGALPKKTFSMGEAEDKRYYLETQPI